MVDWLWKKRERNSWSPGISSLEPKKFNSDSYFLCEKSIILLRIWVLETLKVKESLTKLTRLGKFSFAKKKNKLPVTGISNEQNCSNEQKHIWSEFDKKTFPRHEHEKLFIYKQL